MPRCPYGAPYPPERLRDKYVVRAETSLQELCVKALLKPGDCKYFDRANKTLPIYRCACSEYHHWYPQRGREISIQQFTGSQVQQFKYYIEAPKIEIYKFISLLSPDEKLPKTIKQFMHKIARDMCDIHDAELCMCGGCMADQYHEYYSSRPRQEIARAQAMHEVHEVLKKRMLLSQMDMQSVLKKKRMLLSQM